jgi:Tfp pilus assembly protein PilF
LCTVPVIVLFTKADMLDAQTIKHLVNAGMNVEDAADKAPEESVTRFQKNFGQQLYKKKYPPKGHVYFRGATNSFIYRQQIN